MRFKEEKLGFSFFFWSKHKGLTGNPNYIIWEIGKIVSDLRKFGMGSFTLKCVPIQITTVPPSSSDRISWPSRIESFPVFIFCIIKLTKRKQHISGDCNF